MTKRMTEHAWTHDGHDKIGNAIERCVGCGIRKIDNCTTFWQRAKGARWIDTEDYDIPPCARRSEEEKDTIIKALADAVMVGGHGKPWHLHACRMERRGDPSCECIPECSAALYALRLVGRLK